MKTFIKTLTLALPLFFTWPAHAQNAGTAKADSRSEMKVYLAQDDSARKVMEHLLSMFGKKLMGDNLPNTPVSGRFEVRSVEDVMSYFLGAYQLNYFTNGVNVHVYKSSDWRTKRIYVGGNDKTNDDWKDMLTSAGLYYKEFPVVVNREKKELVVSGPRAYLNLIENTFGERAPDPSEVEKFGIKLMAFPLKHASVEDRQTVVRDSTITTPGALSVLLNLLGLPPQMSQYSPTAKKPGFNIDKGFFNGPSSMLNNTDRIANMPLSSTENLTGRDDKKDPTKNDQPISVTADPRTNTILIRDAGSRYDYYKTLIDQLDKSVALIEVEAMMVEVDQKTLNELGVEFGVRTRNLAYDFPGSSVGNLSLFNQGALSIVDPGRFVARLRALSADENVKVLARPTILTQDNVTAYIDLSQTVYLQLTGERVAQAQPVTAGSLLQVTPRMVRDDFEEKIFIRIDIQDGSIADTSTTGISTPRVQNTSISTQAVIEREKAILIGGYNRDSTEVTDYKVPLLGDLPFIGKAFTSSDKKTQTMSRLFLITPRLIDPPANNNRSTRIAVDQLQKAFPQQKNKDLEPTSSMKLDTQIQRLPR